MALWFLGRERQPCWLKVLTLNPFPCATSFFPAPGAQQPGLAQRGQVGEVGGCFQLHLCLGKIPFHVAACDLSRRLCRWGRPAGSRGRCCSGGTLTPCTRQTAAAPQNLEGTERILFGGWGWEASCPHLAAGNTKAADGLGQPLGTGWMAPVPAPRGGGCCDSASLYLAVCQLTAQP